MTRCAPTSCPLPGIAASSRCLAFAAVLLLSLRHLGKVNTGVEREGDRDRRDQGGREKGKVGRKEIFFKEKTGKIEGSMSYERGEAQRCAREAGGNEVKCGRARNCLPTTLSPLNQTSHHVTLG